MEGPRFHRFSRRWQKGKREKKKKEKKERKKSERGEKTKGEKLTGLAKAPRCRGLTGNRHYEQQIEQLHG